MFLEAICYKPKEEKFENLVVHPEDTPREHYMGIIKSTRTMSSTGLQHNEDDEDMGI